MQITREQWIFLTGLGFLKHPTVMTIKFHRTMTVRQKATNILFVLSVKYNVQD